MKERKDLKGIAPVKQSKRGRKVIYYEKVKVSELEKLGLDTLRNLLNKKTRKGRFEVTKRDGNFLVKYFSKEASKPCLILLKRNGRVYMFRDVWQNVDMRRLASHQASILLEILDFFDLVLNFRARNFSWKAYPVGEFGFAPKEDTPKLGKWEDRGTEGKIIWE